MVDLDLPGRPLAEDELAALVGALARRQDLLRPFVSHRRAARHAHSVHADEHVGIWVISWLPGHDTGFHDHAGSLGAVAVVRGAVYEERPAWGRLGRVFAARAGDRFTFGDADVHRVYAAGDAPAVTLHAYSPPLRGMGVYRLGDDGRMHRTAVAWDHVLVA